MISLTHKHYDILFTEQRKAQNCICCMKKTVKMKEKKERKAWMEIYKDAISCLGVVGFVLEFFLIVYFY